VAVNQHMLDKGSPVDFVLDPGNYVVDITLTGYAPIHKVITVDKGGKAVIDDPRASRRACIGTIPTFTVLPKRKCSAELRAR
jgi:hypothetical protein